MIRRILFALLLCAPSFAVAAPPLGSVCELRAPRWTGSGTLIGTTATTGLVLTARHVADHVGMEMEAVWLWAPGQPASGARVIALVPGRAFNSDMALLIVNRPPGVAAVPVAVYDPRTGPWTAAGFRDARMRVTTTNQSRYANDIVYLPAPFIPGMSGGPCFDGRGRLVAIVVGSDFRTLGICSDGPTLQKFIATYRK